MTAPLDIDTIRARAEDAERYRHNYYGGTIQAAFSDRLGLLAEVDRLRAEKKELEGQLERLLHKTEVEADYLCPTDMRMLEVINERDRYRALLGEAVTMLKYHGLVSFGCNAAGEPVDELSADVVDFLRRVEGEAKV